MTTVGKDKLGKPDMLKFLDTEYQECFDQMRHYETVADSYLKFTFAGYPVIIGGISALYTILDADYRNLVTAVLLLLTFFAGFAVLMLLLTNRSYFAVVARQVNAIRSYFLKNCEEINFIQYNRAYLDSNKPKAYNSTSTSTWLFDIISILNSIVGAGFLYFILFNYEVKNSITWAVCGALIVILFIVQRIWGISYLKRKDKEHETQAKPTENSMQGI